MTIGLSTPTQTAIELEEVHPAVPADSVRASRQAADHEDHAPSSRAPAPPAVPRGAPLRMRPGDLFSRYRMAQLRRMNSMAFGQAANAQLSEQANEVIAELGGQRVPTGDRDLEGDEAVKRYIVLREALEIVRETLKLTPSDAAQQELHKKIEQSIVALVADHGERIVGDLNIAGTLERFSGEIRERDQLRRLYHDAICQHGSIVQTFDTIVKVFGAERMVAAVKHLGQALKEDMLAPMHSADPKFLGGLYSELQRVMTLLSVYASLGSLDKLFPSLRKAKVRAEFVGKLLRLVTDGGTPAALKQMADWLASAPQADEPEPAPDPANPKAVMEHAAAGLRREEAVRSFLLKEVPVHLWKPNTRAATTTLAKL